MKAKSSIVASEDVDNHKYLSTNWDRKFSRFVLILLVSATNQALRQAEHSDSIICLDCVFEAVRMRKLCISKQA